MMMMMMMMRFMADKALSTLSSKSRSSLCVALPLSIYLFSLDFSRALFSSSTEEGEVYQQTDPPSSSARFFRQPYSKLERRKRKGT